MYIQGPEDFYVIVPLACLKIHIFLVEVKFPQMLVSSIFTFYTQRVYLFLFSYSEYISLFIGMFSLIYIYIYSS